MNYTDAQIWSIIAVLAVATFLIRFSFLGLIGDRPMPPLVLRLLRYTPVTVLPAMVAPLVIWPDATGGVFDPLRVLVAAVTVATGMITRHVMWSIAAGGLTFALGLWLQTLI